MRFSMTAATGSLGSVPAAVVPSLAGRCGSRCEAGRPPGRGSPGSRASLLGREDGRLPEPLIDAIKADIHATASVVVIDDQQLANQGQMGSAGWALGLCGNFNDKGVPIPSRFHTSVPGGDAGRGPR